MRSAQVARRGRHVVCATPESVKSLLLKFMEELERIEACDLDELLPNSSARDTKEVCVSVCVCVCVCVCEGGSE
jgi:hypothetical protein